MYGYRPSSQVAALATETTMNNKARRLFYIYHPAIETKQDFHSHCPEDEHTIILGCYVGQKGIYIYNVTDVRLSGIQQVTAAHELLHAAYERLNKQDKAYVDRLIIQAYGGVTDQRIRANVETYRKAGADTTNELHSILGTEVANLPVDLENYYRRYFNDRTKIINFSMNYEQAFSARQKIVDSADAQLKILKSQIDNLENSLQKQLQNINNERDRMQDLLSARQYEDYNAAVPGYNSSVRKYNQDVAGVRSIIDQYNKLVNVRNASATEENELIKAIDSRPDTVKTQ